ncbi:DNA replication initiation factor cdc45 [Cordyceps javanica]|uniref:DNA replication initiation factor cdc45 n=1 Tax=Cordyceps javanica TaxID=43265 RepID=A0A545UU76_9HYPO|nr:DNA replication initiation factor cdc45 [Cordyceps javanica]TQW04911.1 DNA replication initiation factor cdc45 [Cordyceps javanica]
MGIPHLISTLEPYVQHAVLQDVDVVIDGPGLAHHILHVCRINGVDHPSYQLLGATAANWLNNLASQNAVIRTIYFDGYLPSSKLPVRMQRAVKSTSQLALFRGYSPRGCPRYHITEPLEASSVDAFKNGRPKNKPLEAPSFLVPAIIEALQRSDKYSPVVKVVPGEADGYCAKAVAEAGGIVITSDSDLLVHDLGAGGVALLRDIYRDNDGVVRAAVYRPREIFRTLGLSGISNIRRFAYERSCSVHTTTAMLVRACSGPVRDRQSYTEFCIQYSEEERAVVPIFSSGDKLMLDELDPRWSELLLEMSQQPSAAVATTFRMFLPVLIDNPEKGTAWENSRCIRQVAYSLARSLLSPAICGPVHEYRRVQTRDQSGRQVPLLTQSSMRSQVSELADTLQSLAKLLPGSRDSLYWLLAYVVLDVRGSAADARSPFAAEVLLQQQAQWPSESTATVAWSFAHFVAQLQATYYSLRMLRQLVRASPPDAKRAAGPAAPLSRLSEALDALPPLQDSPGVRGVSEMLSATPAGKIRQVLAHFVELPKSQTECKSSGKRTKKQKAIDGGVSKKSTRNTATSNMFDLLPME